MLSVMKVFMFMYPIKQFFNEVTGQLSIMFDPTRGNLGPDDLYGINKIIDARYRSEGYKIVWVFYGKPDDKYAPNIDNLSEYVTAQPDDLFISSGGYDGEPNFKFMFKQLPWGIDELVVGGFHWMSCVAFTADYAINALGLKTYVDEDTTQAYFVKTSAARKMANRDIDLAGEDFHPWQMGESFLIQQFYYPHIIKNPWMVRQMPKTSDGFTFYINEQLMTFSGVVVKALLKDPVPIKL